MPEHTTLKRTQRARRAALLSALLPGLGQFYNGQWERGFALVVGLLILAAIEFYVWSLFLRVLFYDFPHYLFQAIFSGTTYIGLFLFAIIGTPAVALWRHAVDNAREYALIPLEDRPYYGPWRRRGWIIFFSVIILLTVEIATPLPVYFRETVGIVLDKGFGKQGREDLEFQLVKFKRYFTGPPPDAEVLAFFHHYKPLLKTMVDMTLVVPGFNERTQRFEKENPFYEILKNEAKVYLLNPVSLRKYVLGGSEPIVIKIKKYRPMWKFGFSKPFQKTIKYWYVDSSIYRQKYKSCEDTSLDELQYPISTYKYFGACCHIESRWDMCLGMTNTTESRGLFGNW